MLMSNTKLYVCIIISSPPSSLLLSSSSSSPSSLVSSLSSSSSSSAMYVMIGGIYLPKEVRAILIMGTACPEG